MTFFCHITKNKIFDFFGKISKHKFLQQARVVAIEALFIILVLKKIQVYCGFSKCGIVSILSQVFYSIPKKQNFENQNYRKKTVENFSAFLEKFNQLW